MNRPTPRRLGLTSAAIAATLTVAALTLPAAQGAVEPGTPAKDVHIGLDDDNAANSFIQPASIVAKQDLDNADVVFGRGADDLLIGGRGSDTLLGGPGSDIMVGGPDRSTTPNSDVAVGDQGDDVFIWAPGDGNDAFVGNEGYDTMIFAPLVTDANGDAVIQTAGSRQIPRVTIGGQAGSACTIVRVPATQDLGYEFLVRFTVGGVPKATVRQKDIERVLCPSPKAGYVRVADLTAANPTWSTVTLGSITGVVGAIVAP